MVLLNYGRNIWIWMIKKHASKPKSLPQIKVNINCFKFVDLEWKFDKSADFSLLSKLILSPYAIVDRWTRWSSRCLVNNRNILLKEAIHPTSIFI